MRSLLDIVLCLCVRDRKKFTASNGWLARFLHKYRLSVQRSRTVRRPVISDEHAQYVSHFLETIKRVFEEYDPCLILNMDEMNIGQGDSHVQVIARRNSSNRRIKSQYDNKTSLTACLTIIYDGNVLRPMYTKRGKTQRALTALEINASRERGNDIIFVCKFDRSF